MFQHVVKNSKCSMSKQITVYNFFYDQIYLLTCHLLFIMSMLQVKIKFRLKFY